MLASNKSRNACQNVISPNLKTCGIVVFQSNWKMITMTMKMPITNGIAIHQSPPAIANIGVMFIKVLKWPNR